MQLIGRFVNREEGQGLVEYGLLLAGIVLIVVTVFPTLRTKVTQLFNDLIISLT